MRTGIPALDLGDPVAAQHRLHDDRRIPGQGPGEDSDSAQAFESDEEPFPRFHNIAGEIGLDTFNLAGGAVADDFDGDGGLDLLVTTADTRGQLRVYRQTDGRFVERTEQAGLSGSPAGSTWCRPTTTTTATSTSSCCAAPGSGSTGGIPSRCCATTATARSPTSRSRPAWRGCTTRRRPALGRLRQRRRPRPLRRQRVRRA